MFTARCYALALMIAIASADQAPKAETAVAPTRSATSSPSGAPGSHGPPVVDHRFASPRTTLRTLLAAINATEDDPSRIDTAIACLDLEHDPPADAPGRLAFELELVFRALETPTWSIPDIVAGDEYHVGEDPKLRITLRKMPDGRWLIDGQTLRSLRAMRAEIYRRNRRHPPKEKIASNVPGDFASPRALFFTFMDGIKKNDLDAAGRCLDLESLPAPARRIASHDLAVKTKQILDRNVFVIFQDLPDEPLGPPLEAVVRRDGRVVVERESSGPRQGQWLFNPTTVESVDRLYDAYSASPIVPELVAYFPEAGKVSFRQSSGLWLRSRVPEAWQAPADIPGLRWLKGYQALGLGMLVLLTVPTYFVAGAILRGLASIATRWRGAPPTNISDSWVRALAALAVVALWIQGILLLDLPLDVACGFFTVLVPMRCVVRTLALYLLVDPAIHFIAWRAIASPHASTRASMGYPIVSLLLKLTILGVGLAELLELFDFDVATVLAGLGIGGLAFALAAQDSLKNFFGSVMLVADHTFRVGDQIRIGGNEGLVESVGLRCTRIRCLDDSLLTVPNSDLTTEHVSNYGARRFRRYHTAINVAYGTPLSMVAEFRDGIIERIRARREIHQEKFDVVISDLGSSSIEILVQVFFDVPDSHAELAARQGLILDIVGLAEKLGISPLAKSKG